MDASAAGVIEVQDLSRSFRVYRKRPGLRGAVRGLVWREHELVEAVRGISFRVEEGELGVFWGRMGRARRPR